MEGGREEEGGVGGGGSGPRSGSHQLTAAVLGGAPGPRGRPPCQQQAQQDGGEAGGGHLSIPTADRQEGSAGNTGGQLVVSWWSAGSLWCLHGQPPCVGTLSVSAAFLAPGRGRGPSCSWSCGFQLLLARPFTHTRFITSALELVVAPRFNQILDL